MTGPDVRKPFQTEISYILSNSSLINKKLDDPSTGSTTRRSPCGRGQGRPPGPAPARGRPPPRVPGLPSRSHNRGLQADSPSPPRAPSPHLLSNLPSQLRPPSIS
uniref:Uncharacterized protein n=1 Tax=Aegilops tauschii subsp. strangulata TaxID=200361 RepID=A0A453JQ52_AEGTS